jgi:hypothetical protein
MATASYLARLGDEADGPCGADAHARGAVLHERQRLVRRGGEGYRARRIHLEARSIDVRADPCERTNRESERAGPNNCQAAGIGHVRRTGNIASLRERDGAHRSASADEVEGRV